MSKRTLMAARVSNPGGSSADIALAVGQGPMLTFWVRETPKGSVTPRWSQHSVPATYWPGLSSTARSTACGTIAAALRNKKLTTGAVEVGGLWTVNLDSDDEDALAAAPTPASVFGRVSLAMESAPAREVSHPRLSDGIYWLLDGPVAAEELSESLKTWTVAPGNLMEEMRNITPVAPVAKPKAAAKAAVSPEDVPIMVEGRRKNGKAGLTPFYPRFIIDDQGEQVLNTEWLRRCYNEGEQETVGISGIMGVGKSMLVAAAFQDEYRDKGVNFFDQALLVGSKGMSELDITGGPVENPVTGKMEMKEGKLPFCMKKGVKLFFDEAWLVNPPVWGKILPALDARGILERSDDMGGTVHAEEGFGVIFAGNLGVQGSSIFEPLWGRFSHTPEMLTHWPTVHKVLGNEFDAFVTVLRVLDEMRLSGDLAWSPQFREAVMAKTAVQKHGPKVMMMSLLKKFRLEQDRELAWAEFNRTLKIGPVPSFYI